MEFYRKFSDSLLRLSVAGLIVGIALLVESIVFSDSLAAPWSPELERCTSLRADNVQYLKHHLGEPVQIKSTQRGYWMYFEGPVVALVDETKERVLLLGCKK